MSVILDILVHPAFMGAAGLVGLAAVALLVDRGKVRASLAVGGITAVLMAVLLASSWQARGTQPTLGGGSAAHPSVVGSRLVAGAKAEDGCGEAVVRRGSVFLYMAPSDSAPKITKLVRGDRVLIACANADRAGAGIKWTRVQYEMWEGWVPERVQGQQGAPEIYLERLPPSTLYSAE
jgi:hypothetical protein